MSDRQLAKYRVDDDLYRIRWYGYGSGVAAVLERLDDRGWSELDQRDSGKGTPSTAEEDRIIEHMKSKITDHYAPDFTTLECVEGREWRRRS